MEKQTRLEFLLALGTLWVEGREFVGRASDGVVVSLGGLDERKQIEAYLLEHPTPETW